jgi:outer membrane protein
MRRPALAVVAGVMLGEFLALAAVTGSRVAHAQPVEAPAPGLRVFTLADAERVARAQQPQGLIARAATNIAEGQSEQVRAPLLPQLTGTATYTRETGNYAPRPGVVPVTTMQGTGTTQTSSTTVPGTATTQISLTDSSNYWSFGLTGTQLIYDFGQTWDKYRASRATVEAQRASEQITRLAILSAVRRAYFNACTMSALVGVARETLDDQTKHLAQVQGFVDVGTQPPIAVATQRAAVANARVALISAQNNYETAKSQLNQAAGIVGGTDYDVAQDDLPPIEDEDQPLATLFAKALAARPEFANLQKQRDAQDALLRAARGGYGPAFSAAAGGTEQGVDKLVPNWYAELLLTWPFFQGGLTRGQVHQAEAEVQSVDAQRSLELLQVQLDVDSARLAVRAAKATITASDDVLTNAREQLRLAEQRYVTGVGSIIELTDAQVAYTSAEAQVVQARYGLATARAQLLAALGRT